MNPYLDLKAKIPANKFYPPRIGVNQGIFRKRLVEDLLHKDGPNKKVISIVAQAGQGKTTLVLQYLEADGLSYGWYQVGKEDSDPILLFNALLTCITRALPDFQAPLLEDILASSDITTQELSKLANLLLSKLDIFLQSTFTLVFDDLHFLQGCEISLALLNHFIETSPPKIRFILASRQPVELDNKDLKYGNMRLHLDNPSLAMDKEEISELYENILEMQVSRQIIEEIQQKTNGWCMGVILVGHGLKKDRGNPARQARWLEQLINSGDIYSYFREEIFAQLPKNLQHPLLQLSFLEDIPIDLAKRITGIDDISQKLSALMTDNYFIRHLDAKANILGFHNLFQEFLQARAWHELGKEEIKTILEGAAQYCLEQGKSAPALRYLLKSGDMEAMEKVLAVEGMGFLATNQTTTLALVLKKIPEEIIFNRGWFSLFSGLVHMDSEPEKTKPFLKRALHLFSQNHDKIGELLAISHLIQHYIVTTGVYKEGVKDLERAVRLFAHFSEELPVYAKILTAINLANGCCFFSADFTEANRLSSLAVQLARKHGAVNFQAAALMIQGYEQIFLGQQQACLAKIEQAQALIHLPQIGTFNMMALRFLQVNYLAQYTADFSNYFNQKSIIMDVVGRKVVKQTIPGLFLNIFEMDTIIAQGQYDHLLDLATQMLATSSELLSPHLRSQILQYQALALAMKEKKTEGLAAANKSIRLRDSAGGPYYVIKNKLCIAPVYGLLSSNDRAIRLLTEAIQGANEMGNHNLSACGYLYRAYFYLKAGQEGDGFADLMSGLKIMRHHQYHHFWGWIPSIMAHLFAVAVKENIEAAYAKRLAAEQMDLIIMKNGQTIPLLRLHTLGDLRISMQNETIVSAEELTPAQRELIVLLAASPALKLSQEKVQYTLWPDSPPDKARTKLDTLLSRCRKTLTTAIKPHAANNYINLQKGILCLENCRVDAIEFIEKAKEGLDHSRNKEYWQAGNAFYLAANLWHGMFAPTVIGDEKIRNFRDKLIRQFIDMSLKWADILRKPGQQPEAISVAHNALQYDCSNDLLIRLLYRLYRRQPLNKGQQVLKGYKDTLTLEGYSVDEIEELLADIRNNQAT